MVNMAVTMDNFKKRMNGNEVKGLESANPKKALQDLCAPLEESNQKVVSDNDDYSGDEFDDASDNTAEPPIAVTQKPRPLSGISPI